MRFHVAFTTNTSWVTIVEAEDRDALDALLEEADDVLHDDAVEIDGGCAEITTITAI